jgi:MFS transporter, MHS family, proline/betaine transporter
MSIEEHKRLRQVIAATMIGNGLEWYDYALYGQFAYLISDHFFPPGNEALALIQTFGIFAAGFLMRPLGAIIFGNLGDRLGRKNALVVSILMMSIPTAFIGILPTFEKIGFIAPLCLIVIRLLQGIAIGGEFGGSIIYLVEHSGKHNKNFLGSLSVLSMFIGLLCGALISSVLAFFISPSDFNDWGWRIPFILAFLAGLVGLYIRMKIGESPVFMDAKEAGHLSDKPLRETLKTNLKEVVLGVGIYLGVTIPFYLQLIYMNTYMMRYLNFYAGDALKISSICLVLMMMITYISAKLADKWNRMSILKGAALAYVLFAFPFVFLLHQESLFAIVISQLIFSAILAFYTAPIPSLLVDLFPPKTRYTGMSLACNLSAAVFGGTLPLVLSWLLSNTGNDYFISIYIMIGAVVPLMCLRSISMRDA